MKRVIVVHPPLRPSGGGHAVATWALQALRDHFDLSLLTWDAPDYEGINRTFGTSLRHGDFVVEMPSAPLLRLMKALPGRNDQLAIRAMMRRLKHLEGRRPYDVVLSTYNEMDFGRRGVQYVHFPYPYTPQASGNGAWYQRLPGATSAYHLACQAVSRATPDGRRRNLTLANSHYTAEHISEVRGVEATVVYPPVPGGFPDVPWDDREDGVVCLGRIAPMKQLTGAVAIVEALRARGHPLRLHLVGTPEDHGYEATLRRLAQSREWLRLHVDLGRKDLTSLVARQRYGLHAQVGEHFGIAPAELVRAGCMTFVARPGGPVEIVGHEADLTFSSPTDAVDTIDRVLRDRTRLQHLRAHLRSRREVFTEERFMREIRNVVEEFAP